MGHAGAHFVAQALEVLGHQRAGAHLAVAQLGVLVDVAVPGDDLGFEGVGQGVEAVAEVCGGRGQGGEGKQQEGQGAHSGLRG
jgi:hypothetical protein